MKSYLPFSIICLILCCLLGCTGDPGTKIIDAESDFQAIEGEARIVLEWLKAGGYYLHKYDEKGQSFYILSKPFIIAPRHLHLGANLDEGSWTRGELDEVALTVYHDHFMIKVEGIGEAGFTFDEDRGLQVYDRSQKDN